MASDPDHPNVQRRLSAILITDVAGYSRLMGIDEEGTLARLKSYRRDLIDPAVAEHHGRFVKLTGDGALVEFASVVEAVRCAIRIQQAILARNAELEPEKRIELRIGVNLGDVIVEEDDIYGDGVNLAARLQTLADPGGICISQAVYAQIKGKLPVAFTSLGEQRMKNIAEPVGVYRVETGDRPGRIVGVDSAAAKPGPAGRTSIAVLPFENMSGDPGQDYFSDGLTEDIITELSKYRELRVIARNSSFQFRGKAVDVREVARRLDVQFVVEGSVRKTDNRARVTVQLIDGLSNAHLWADRYDKSLVEIFQVQDEITRMVVTRIASQAVATLGHRVRSQLTSNWSAYDCYLRARTLVKAYESYTEAEPALLKALELDPDFAAPHALLATVHCMKYFHDNDVDHLQRALQSSKRALALDPEEPWANHAMGLSLTFLRRLGEAGHYLERAISLNPNDASFLAVHALWLNFVGRSEDAWAEIEEALRRDPYAIDWFWEIRGEILMIARRYGEAIESFHRMKSQELSHCYLAVCHAELGQFAEAWACLQQFRMENPGVTPEAYLATEPYADASVVQRLTEALKRTSG